jgi:hypothetical protein
MTQLHNLNQQEQPQKKHVRNIKNKNYDFAIATDDSSLVFDVEKNPDRQTYQSQYAIIKSEILDDRSLSAEEKIFLVTISSFMCKKGYCWATNDYLAKVMNLHEKKIQRLLSSLRRKNYLKTLGIQFNFKTFRRIYMPEDFEKLKKFFLRTNVSDRDETHLSGDIITKIYKKNISNKLDIQKAADGPPPGVANAPPPSKFSKKELIKEKHMETANYFHEKVDELKIPRKKPDMSKEANEIRLLCDKDGVDIEEVKPVIDWLFTKSFWQEKGVLPMKTAKFRKDFGKYLQQYRKRNDIEKTGFTPKNGWENYNKNRECAWKNCRKKYGWKHFEALESCLKQKYGSRESISYDMPTETFQEIFEKWWNERKD